MILERTRDEKRGCWVYTLTVFDSDVIQAEFDDLEKAFLGRHDGGIPGQLRDLSILALAIERAEDPRETLHVKHSN